MTSSRRTFEPGGLDDEGSTAGASGDGDHGNRDLRPGFGGFGPQTGSQAGRAVASADLYQAWDEARSMAWDGEEEW